jgi:hypothetical protein
MSDEVVFLAFLVTMFSLATFRAIWWYRPDTGPVPHTHWNDSASPKIVRWHWSDVAFGPRRVLIRYGLPVFALFCVAGLTYGGYHWYRILGSTHVVDEYRFKITPERDSEYADISFPGDDILISIYHRGNLIATRIHIGYISEDADSPTFTVRRLPNESLILVTPDDRETEVVFAYDTATGESYPYGKGQGREDYREFEKRLQARIRACPGFERYELRFLSR